MNSALNPEAPEFFPNFKTATQGGYSSVKKTIRSSNNLPAGASHDIHKTYSTYHTITIKLSDNVVSQSNQVVVTELSGVKLQRNDDEYNAEKVIDANDSMLDRVFVNIDSASGVNKSSEKFMKGLNPLVNVSSWNKNPVVSKIQVGSATFIGAKNIPRPQLTFKDPVDNSHSLWVPKISDKQNNVKPLALNIIYNDGGEAVGYEHPYKIELDLYHPPTVFIDHAPEPPSYPPPFEDTKLTFVSTEAEVDDLVRHLSGVTEIAVDVEHHSYRSYQGITCLIQISTNDGGDFIIDALAAREHIHKLNLIFTDPKKLKVLHGAESDVLWLQRDFGVYIVGLFDTHQAAKILKMNGLSLKHLLKKYCLVDADKKYQLADWRIRPLPEELVHYARMDTHYLIYIWRLMKEELVEADAGQLRLLLSAFEQSRQICGNTYNKEAIHDDSHVPLYQRSKKSFNSRQMAALQLLYKWRDAQAREFDESTMYLLPNHMMLALAEALPREVQGVNACCSPMPPFIKQHLLTVHRMLLSCRKLPLEPYLYQIPTGIKDVINTQKPVASHKVHDVRQISANREKQRKNVNRANASTGVWELHPDVRMFVPAAQRKKKLISYNGFVSSLNVNAKLFVPPFYRYKKYRSLSQVEEINDYRDKEVKIAATAKGKELIKTEVFLKVAQAKTKTHAVKKGTRGKSKQNAANTSHVKQRKLEKRKRKMSTEKIEKTSPAKPATEDIVPKPNSTKNKCATNKNDHQATLYQNVNYRKFYDDTEKTRKQPKMKVKKHK